MAVLLYRESRKIPTQNPERVERSDLISKLGLRANSHPHDATPRTPYVQLFKIERKRSLCKVLAPMHIEEFTPD
jgi:hypothetical protein